jgi:hypothetical protein
MDQASVAHITTFASKRTKSPTTWPVLVEMLAASLFEMNTAIERLIVVDGNKELSTHLHSNTIGCHMTWKKRNLFLPKDTTDLRKHAAHLHRRLADQ